MQLSTNSGSKDKAPLLGKLLPRKRVAENSPSDEQLAKAHAHYAFGVIRDLNDENDEALAEFSNAAELDLANESLVLAVSSRYLANRKPDKALEILTKATARPDASGALFAKLGSVYSQLGKTEQAMEANRTAIKKSPRLFAGYQNLFLNYLQEKRADDALKLLDQTAGQTDADADFFVRLGELYLAYSRQFPSQKEMIEPKALAALNRAQELKPEDPQTALKLADGFSLFGQTDKAVAIYREMLRRPIDSPLIREAVRAKLAEFYIRGNDHAGAAKELEALLREDPTNPQAHYFLGSIAYEGKQFAKAEEHFSKTLLLNPNFEQAYYDLAGVQINSNKPDDALETLDKARSRFSDNFLSEFFTGLAYAHKKDYVRAINHYVGAEVIARASEPKRLTENFYFQLAAAYERNGEYEDAEKYFKKSLELAPDFHEALNYLGYMWAERGEKLEEARVLVEKALTQEPTNAAYLDSLGWVLFKLNQPQQALEQLLKAQKFSEEPDATLYDHLGEVYAALRQTDKAREAWKKSLTVQTNDQVRTKLEQNSPSKKK